MEIPVAVAIPEGICLPLLSIAAVLHAARRMEIMSVSTLDDDPVTTMTTTTTMISIILVPLEPTEGRDWLRHMLQNARPALVLVAADCDQQRLQEITSQTSSSSISPENLPDDSHHQEIILPQLVDIRTWIQNIAQENDTSPAGVDAFYDREQLKKQQQQNQYDNSFAFLTQQQSSSRQLASASEEQELLSRSPSSSSSQRRISHIVYTSGTTGMPKGCVSSVAALQHYVQQKNAIHGITASSVVLLASAISFFASLGNVFWYPASLGLPVLFYDAVH